MKEIEQQQSIQLRKQGMSIKDISKNLQVAKSSVSTWVRHVVLNKKQLKELSEKGFSVEIVEKRRVSRLLHEDQKRKEIMNSAAKDIKNISQKDLHLLGLSLYWGEGGKTNHGVARISNSDPYVIAVMMRFFKEVFLVPDKKFRGSIHTHSKSNVKQAEKYWSSISGIPKNQFYKTYVKKSVASLNKRKTLPYGTFDIYVCDTKLYLKIMGQIEKIKQLAIKESIC